jgi:hypothetical protein
MLSNDGRQLTVGLPSEWAEFENHHRLFLDCLNNLTEAMSTAFVRDLPPCDGWDKFIFSMGRVCIEDFWEMALLAGNGYGIGALKLLRPLYERTITLLYLHANPSLYEDFLDWDYVALYKLHQAAISSNYGIDLLPAEEREKAKQLYLSVKEKYMVKSCDVCGTRRVNHSWTKTDIPSMAKKTELAGLLVPAYYIPITHLHSTPKAIFARLQISPEGIAGINPRSQPKEAAQALVYGHDIVLSILSLQEKHFHPDRLRTCLDVAVADYEMIWKGKASCAVGLS